MSKVSGACTGMVGCRPDAGCHALKRTPATASPGRPVAVMRQAPAVAGDRHAGLASKPVALHLQALDRGIDEAHRAADRAFLAQHVPGLQRLADLELDAAMLDLAEEREAELALRVEPDRVEGDSRRARSASTSEEVLPRHSAAA